jgi:hypothetical protein
MSFAESLEEREDARQRMLKASKQAAAQLRPLWHILVAELNVVMPKEPDASTLRFGPSNVVVALQVLKPATPYEGETAKALTVSIGADVIDAGETALIEHLRHHYPCHCPRCGINFPVGTAACVLGDRAGMLWRKESPRPTYYIENIDSYGLNGIWPGTRGLRYAIELENWRVFGIEITRPKGQHFFTPARSARESIVEEIASKIPAITEAMNGNSKSEILVSRFSFIHLLGLPHHLRYCSPHLPGPVRVDAKYIYSASRRLLCRGLAVDFPSRVGLCRRIPRPIASGQMGHKKPDTRKPNEDPRSLI